MRSRENAFLYSTARMELSPAFLLKIQECREQTAIPFHHALRRELEGPLFDFMRESYGAKLKEFWETSTFPKVTETENTVLMVERREHPNMEFCLQNFMYFTRAQNFSLTIICSKENESQIRKILGNHIETTDLRVLWEGNSPTAWDEYSQMFMSSEFWKTIQAKWILSVQTDCYLRKPLPEILWTVEHIASPWSWRPWMVGGGGLSFRNRQSTIEMCDCKNLNTKIKGEDAFFATVCAYMKKKILPLEIAETIFSESRVVEDPVGTHQWWTYCFQNDDVEILRKYTKIYTTLEI
jgi:hypothetical protein